MQPSCYTNYITKIAAEIIPWGTRKFTCPQQWRRERPDWEIKVQQWPRDVGPMFGPLAEENNTAM